MAYSNGTEQQPAPKSEPEPVVVERGNGVSVEWRTPETQPQR